MAVSANNRARYRAILVSRQFKWLFKAMPTRLQHRAAAWFWNTLFKAEDGQLHVVGEHVLADLRDFAAGPLFANDPLIMARRIGRREVFDRIVNYLNLDEATVQKLMILDDGLGD